MATPILSGENFRRHLELHAQHSHYEKLYHYSRDRIKAAMGQRKTLTMGGYTVVLREHQRMIFQSKLFALEHPDIHEQFVKPTNIVQVIITGPPLAPASLPGEGKDVKLTDPGYIQYLIQTALPPIEELATEF